MTQLARQGMLGGTNLPTYRTLDYAPLNADQPGVTITGTLTTDGSTPITTPIFIPEDGANNYADTIAGNYLSSDGDPGVDPWSLDIGTAQWGSDSNETVEEAVFIPDGANTGTPVAVLTTRSKTTGQFALYSGVLYQNRGDDTTPDWVAVATSTGISELLTLIGEKANLAGGNTFSGEQTLTGQLQLTGQSATDANSAMTRGLGDARFPRKWVAIQGGAVTKTSDVALETLCQISSLPAGTFRIRAFGACTVATGGATGGGLFAQLNFPSGTIRGHRWRVGFSTSSSVGIELGATTTVCQVVAGAADYTDGTWTLGVSMFYDIVLVTASSGDVTLQARQNSSNAKTTTFPAGSAMIEITQLA